MCWNSIVDLLHGEIRKLKDSAIEVDVLWLGIHLGLFGSHDGIVEQVYVWEKRREKEGRGEKDVEEAQSLILP